MLLAWLCLTTSSFASTPAPEALRLPQSIAHYYADYNFVAAFTTFDERVALQRGRLLGRPAPDLNSPRLQEIQVRLHRLDARILRSDPGIVAPGFKSKGTFPHGFFQITAARCGPNEIVLKAMVQRIEPATQAKLIAAYEEAALKDSTDEAIAGLLRTVQGKSKSQIELHKWTLADGVWLKHEADVVLLEGSGEFVTNCG
jgi:hypothetical protein